MWEFDNIGQYGDFTGTLSHLSNTGVYYDGILSTVQPTINFLYDQVLTNPMIIGLIIVLLVLSLFTFSD